MGVQKATETWGALIHHYIASDAPRRPPIFDGRDYGPVAPVAAVALACAALHARRAARG